MTLRFTGGLVAAGLVLGTIAVHGQTKANWLTDGYDPQRTSWQRNETIISPATAKDMKLLWKLQLDNKPRQMHNLFPPMIVSDVATTQGPRDIGVVAGVS